MSFLLARSILEAALKDRLLLGFIVFIGVIISLSIFIGSSAITEKDQFSSVFAAGGLRILGAITLILFIVSYVRRYFETNNVEYVLSKPISRLGFLTAHLLAFSIMATIISFFIFLAIYFMPSVAASTAGEILWGLSVWVELIIVTFMAVFFSFILRSSVFAILATLGFYVLARLMGNILSILESGTHEGGVFVMMEKIMLLVSFITPRLDLVGQTAWLVYGSSSKIDFSFFFFQGVVFCALIYVASYIDLKRKQF